MSAPNSVAFDVTEIDLDLSGFGTPNPTEHWAYWQYQIIGGGGDIDRNVSNSSSATINFPVNENSIQIRYCLLGVCAAEATSTENKG